MRGLPAAADALADRRRGAAPPVALLLHQHLVEPDGADVNLVTGASGHDTLDACLDGVEAVFLLWPFLTADAAPAVLDAVRRRAQRIVYLSSSSVRDDLEQQSGRRSLERVRRAVAGRLRLCR